MKTSVRLILAFLFIFLVDKGFCQDSLVHRESTIKVNLLMWSGLEYEFGINDEVSVIAGVEALELTVKSALRLKSRCEFRLYLDREKEWFAHLSPIYRYRIDGDISEDGPDLFPVTSIFVEPPERYVVRMHSAGLGVGIGYRIILFKDLITLEFYTRLEKYVYTHFSKMEVSKDNREHYYSNTPSSTSVTSQDKRDLAENWSAGFATHFKIGYRF